MARLNIIDTLWPNGIGQRGDARSRTSVPTWMDNWETTGLLGFEDKNGDGRIQYYNDTNPEMQALAAERGWEGNELTNSTTTSSFSPTPRSRSFRAGSSRWSRPGGLAAALSTAAGLLLAISSALSATT